MSAYSHIRQKLERAFAHYFDANKTGTIVDHAWYFGQIGAAERTLPCVVVKAANPRELYMPGSGAYETTVDFMVFTQIDDETADIAAERIGFIKDVLSNIATVKAALNKPGAGPDGRAVKELTVTGYKLVDEPDDQQDRHWEDTVRISVLAHPWDPA